MLSASELNGKTLLLCEDNALNREIAVALLNEKGMKAVSEENGEDGLKEFADSVPGTYDAILMDVRMPVMDGVEAGQIRLPDREDAKTIPIIAMTADALTMMFRNVLMQA